MQFQGTFCSMAFPQRFLQEALEGAEQHAPGARKTLEDQSAGIVKHVAAAGVVRLPGLLRAIRMLLEAGLVVESEPLIRVLVEVAIVAMWVGIDEERARRVRANTVLQVCRMQQGIEIFGVAGERLNLGPAYQALAAEVRNQAREATALLPIADLAKDADFPTWARDKGQALPPMGLFLYHGLFRLFSSSSHADMQPAFIVASGQTAPMMPTNYSLAAIAALCALVSVAEPLELEREPIAQLVLLFSRLSIRGAEA